MISLQRLACVLVTMAIALPTAAQPWREMRPIQRDLFSLEEAMKLANETNRMLIVYPIGSKEEALNRTRAALSGMNMTPNSAILEDVRDGFTLMEERTWNHPDMLKFIDQHAVFYAVSMTGEQRSEFEALQALSRRSLDGHPHALLYLDSKPVGVLPTADPDHDMASKTRGGPMHSMYGFGHLDPSRFFPKPAEIMFEALAAIDSKRAVDPVWGMLHDQKNPSPVVQIETFYQRETALSPGFVEPAGAGLEFALQTWSDARRWVKEGEYSRALAAYTWLWERAGDLAPELDGTRSWLLAAEMADLARERPEAFVRFAQMHDAMGEWWMHLSSEQWIDYFTLGEVVGRHAWNFDYLAGNTIGWFESEKTTPADVPILSAAEKVKFDLLASRDGWSADDSEARSVIARMKHYSEVLNTLSGENASQAEIEDAVGIYRRVLRHEVSRAYAILLDEGDPAAAAQIARWYTEQERLGEKFAMATLDAARHTEIPSAESVR